MKSLLYIFVLCFLFVTVIAISPDKDRVFDESLSDVPHHSGDIDHDVTYDHDAFLGKDESSKFNKLTPKDSIERLSKIVDKIDINHDGKVSAEELKQWIKMQSQRYLRDDTYKSWKEYKLDNDKLSFDNYKEKIYDSDSDGDASRRDERRWSRADRDGDKVLTKEEFFEFLHPEESEHMRDLVIEESMEELDKNKDGVVDMDEYIGDMWAPEKGEDGEPDWVKTEREQFTDRRDSNKDGKLDAAEVGAWIVPEDPQHVTEEVAHLMAQADVDKDGYLSKDEVLARYDVFVGSQATEYGDSLTRHTEL